VNILLWVMILSITFKALQATIWFASLGFSFGVWPNVAETLTNHDDPLYFITLWFLLLSFTLFGYRGAQKKTLISVFLLLVLGFIAGQRRATYAAFGVMLVGYMVLLTKQDRKILVRALSVFLVVFVLYVGAFWNSGYGRMSMIALSVKATITGAGGVRGDKDFESTMYREYENYNLATTYKLSPVIGNGFGMPFLMPIRLWSIGSFGAYIPHNQILWIIVKTGAVGGFMFWLFFNSIAFNGARIFRKLKDPYLKSLCAICIISILGQCVVSYVDMQLTWTRNMVHLGTLTGLIPVIQNLGVEQPASGTTEKRSRTNVAEEHDAPGSV